ncbi:polysaccharide pyruvyl transferase family protein [Chitinophaga nivalis]|uniref:Polysaccharide pyruvyl transferase family protein n=1 Tax=Chitinophaga nivalis TaxID=2991709 RepID=A0ABT3INT7_9BACT|nr:polysaccharide pyruvyl transferase family protein [Chitinophaga nivalis]MCW3464662.1 polysaccharide pyruvyl transferase family protein [Chitinophaga nivalis]MCW3485647.1 polysaccharide pyruvyl transferase family protein [Chitinophaga nivalis]
MKKALIINEGFSNNLGDQAIRESMTSLLQDSGFVTDFAYFTNPGVPGLPAYQYLDTAVGDKVEQPLSYRTKARLKLAFFYWMGINYRHIRQKLKKHRYDIVVIGGGQLLESSGKDYPSRFAIALYWWTLLIKTMTKARIYVIGVGVGTTFNKKENYLFGKALSRVDFIWVRDEFSRSSLYEKFKHRAVVTPDVAFYNGRNHTPAAASAGKALIGITCYREVFAKYNKSSKSREDYYEEWFLQVQRYLNRKLPVELFYTTITDAAETIAFRDYVKSKHRITLPVARLASVEDLKKLYVSASDVYSGRMHALILAMKHRCTVKAYLISQKLKSFQEEYIDSGKPVSEYSEEISGTFNKLLRDQIKL